MTEAERAIIAKWVKCEEYASEHNITMHIDGNFIILRGNVMKIDSNGLTTVNTETILQTDSIDTVLGFFKGLTFGEQNGQL